MRYTQPHKHKQIAGLAACLKSVDSNGFLTTLTKNLSSLSRTARQNRNILTPILYSCAIGFSLPKIVGNIANIPSFSERMADLGLIVALIPVFLLLFYLDKAISRYKKMKDGQKITHIIPIFMPLVILPIDFGLVPLAPNAISYLSLIMIAYLYSPYAVTNYYARKKLDKRT